MAVDMFIKIDTIKGESKDSTHKEEIELLSFSWGVTQSGTTHSGEGGGAGKVNVQDLLFTKYIDSASPNLLKASCKGTHFKEATITMRKAGDKPLEYLKIKIKDILVSSVSTAGSNGDDRQTESIALNFGQFEYQYTPQKPDGTGGGAIIATWNIPGNSEA
jgi:type VI secretion system secreted protein Hcp